MREPLTEEEERRLRKNHIGPEKQCQWDMQPRPCMYERLLATLAAARSSPAPAEGREATLRPCHITGMHEPDHHLRRDSVCPEQARDIAEQLLAGRDLSTMPRALHPDCYWCGTRAHHDRLTPAAAEQAAWAALSPPVDRDAPREPDDTGTDPVTGDEPAWIAEPDRDAPRELTDDA